MQTKITGKMRSMRLFFSADDLTSGQLVIATCDSHYKILHFHHGGLDKLAQLLEQWSAIKPKAVKDAYFVLQNRIIYGGEILKKELLITL